jgi:predicted nucleotidyltransferase component of viral defense system
MSKNVVNFTKHKSVLLQILKDIYSDLYLANILGFKGGTAALFFYNLDRNSVDLDFDLLDNTKELEVFDRLRKIAEKYGKITESRVRRFNILNVVSYQKGAPQIKIEVNRRGQNDSKYEVKTVLGISMLVIVKEDMFAQKIMAMYERMGKANRDVFDVCFFCKQGFDINKTIVENRSGMTFVKLVESCIQKLEKLNNKNILNGLGELLTDSQKDWVKAKLKEDTIFHLKLRADLD